MQEKITLSLSFSTIIITIGTAAVSIAIAAIFKPAVYILRDFTAWLMINKYIYNEKTRIEIENIERYRKRLDDQFKEHGEYADPEEGIIGGWLHGEKTGEGYIDIHNSTKNLLEEEVKRLEVSIYNKKERLNLILKNLGMNNIKNPIEQLSEIMRDHYEKNPPDDIKVDYDWETQEAIKTIRNKI